MINFLANFLTLLSLVSGFASILFALEGHFTFASWAIILAVILDGLDGQIARMNPVPNEFGKELDSLVDVVAFGMAPSILGYMFIYRDCCFWTTFALFIYLICSVIRLAKYNVTPKEKLANYFYGLPTTASGGVLASFILIYRRKEGMLQPEFIPDILLPEFLPVIFLFIVLVLAFLMVSHIKYLNLDGLEQLLGKRRTKLLFLILVIILIIAAFLKKAGIAVFTFFSIYLLFSPFVVKKLDTRTH